jgi:hypothetical protein
MIDQTPRPSTATLIPHYVLRTSGIMSALNPSSLTGQILRDLALRGTMPQVEVMRTFMARSRALGQRKTPNPSSFSNTFGRFVSGERSRRLISKPAHGLGVTLEWDSYSPAEILASLAARDLARTEAGLDALVCSGAATEADAEWLRLARQEVSSRG